MSKLTPRDLCELICSRCWWREGHACYNEKLLRAGGVNKIPRKVEGDDRNGMEITDALWTACSEMPPRMIASLVSQEAGE